jgi:hypothetical protein
VLAILAAGLRAVAKAATVALCEAIGIEDLKGEKYGGHTDAGKRNEKSPALTGLLSSGGTYLMPSRIMYPAPRMVCSKGRSKPLSILERSREMCTSMTLVCGSK